METKGLLRALLSQKIIGARHTPEEKFIKRIENASKGFRQEYKQLINQKIIIRKKKRTKKGADWHISLNPRKMKDLHTLLGDEHG